AFCRSFQRVVWSDRGGCYDFYRMFRKIIQAVPQLQDAWLSGLCTPGVFSLRDYLVHVITELVSPITFPLRRELAEVLFQLYPGENPGALARFYCDNLQTANAFPFAAYAQLAEVEEKDYDDITQSSVTLGCLLYDMGYMDDAMMYLDRAVSVKNASPMAFLTKGCALIELRDFHGAIKYLKEGQKIDPDSDRFFYNLALAYIELGQLDDAESAIKSGISRSKYPVDLKMQLMRVYVKKGQFVDALPLARYVVSEDPDLFANALRFTDFEEFAQMRAVQKLLNEYGIKL
ncbi:MAG: tetratricopeptide repeat protein, partial [Proteobacteria bacterium]|nr:tetratricopeptide repeat protein [Pseudomonadota bacterium]